MEVQIPDMKHFSGLVRGISGILDKLAAMCIFAVMILVVSNIILRTVFSRPIMGTYELVGFLTALGVGLALAHCALKDGHIAVGFLVERLSLKTQALLAILTNTIALGFWSMSSWYLFKYAHAMMSKGVVSSTAEIPVYPFIALIALGLLGLCLVLISKLSVSISEIIGDFSFMNISERGKATEFAKRAMR